MSVGTLLRELRKSTGKSQEKFAEGIMSKSSYSRIELGNQALVVEDFFYLLKRSGGHYFILDLKNFEYQIRIEFVPLCEGSYKIK